MGVLGLYFRYQTDCQRYKNVNILRLMGAAKFLVSVRRDSHGTIGQAVGGKYWQKQSVLSLHIISITHHTLYNNCLVKI